MNTLIVQGGWKPAGHGYAPGIGIDYPMDSCTNITVPPATPPGDPVVCLCQGVDDPTAALIQADTNYTVLFSYP